MGCTHYFPHKETTKEKWALIQEDWEDAENLVQGATGLALKYSELNKYDEEEMDE